MSNLDDPVIHEVKQSLDLTAKDQPQHFFDGFNVGIQLQSKLFSTDEMKHLFVFEAEVVNDVLEEVKTDKKTVHPVKCSDVIDQTEFEELQLQILEESICLPRKDVFI